MATSLKSIKPEISLATSCPECKSTKLVRDEAHAEISCARCGLVLSDTIISVSDSGEKDFAKPGEQWSSHTHLAPTDRRRTDNGLGSTFNSYARDSAGKLTPNHPQLSRMARINNRLKAPTMRKKNLSRCIDMIRTAVSVNQLNDAVYDSAIDYVKKMVERGFLRGRSLEGCSAAAVYAVTVQLGIWVDPGRIASSVGVERREVLRTYKKFTRLSGLPDLITPNQEAMVRTAVLRLCADLDCPPDFPGRAMALYCKHDEINSLAMRPISLAVMLVGRIAMESGLKYTQKFLAEVSGVTVVTIRRTQRLTEAMIDNGRRDDSAHKDPLQKPEAPHMPMPDMLRRTTTQQA